MLDTVSSTSMGFDPFTSKEKRNNIKFTHLSQFQVNYVLHQPNCSGKSSMPYCCILCPTVKLLLQDFMTVALVKVIFR